MVVSGLALYQIRASRPWLSRDYDVVVSSIAVLTGGILVFQGWRLDPLLLFGQLLTAATATAFAAEVLSLRNKLIERESPDEVDRRLGPGTPEDFRRESWDDTSNGRLSPR